MAFGGHSHARPCSRYSPVSSKRNLGTSWCVAVNARSNKQHFTTQNTAAPSGARNSSQTPEGSEKRHVCWAHYHWHVAQWRTSARYTLQPPLAGMCVRPAYLPLEGSAAVTLNIPATCWHCGQLCTQTLQAHRRFTLSSASDRCHTGAYITMHYEYVTSTNVKSYKRAQVP